MSPFIAGDVPSTLIDVHHWRLNPPAGDVPTRFLRIPGHPQQNSASLTSAITQHPNDPNNPYPIIGWSFYSNDPNDPNETTEVLKHQMFINWMRGLLQKLPWRTRQIGQKQHNRFPNRHESSQSSSIIKISKLSHQIVIKWSSIYPPVSSNMACWKIPPAN